MTTETAQDRPDLRQEGRSAAAAERRVFLARLTLFVERAAPAAVIVGAPAMFIIVMSLLDLWRQAPRAAHAGALLFAIALTALLAVRYRGVRFWPSRREALRRIEADGGLPHDALQALEDKAAAGEGPLWEAHLAAMRAFARKARLSFPGVTADRVDPHGLRYAAFALLAASAVIAGDHAGRRLLAGFWPSDPATRAAGFADVWIEPPAYTGKAPIYLMRGADTLSGLRAQIDAPEGSIVRAQINASRNFKLTFRTGGATIRGEREGPEKSARAALTLLESGVLSLAAGGRSGRWPIGVIDDKSPQIDFVDAPSIDRDGRLAIVASIDDDYGAVSVALKLRLDPDQERPLDAPAFGSQARGAVETIPLDALAGPSGVRGASANFDAHPWAGLRVFAALVITDAAGQTGSSPPMPTTLPAKTFNNPLARAVIEQRQSLAVAPEEWRRVEWAFNAMTLGPQYFYDNPTDYLLLRTAMWRVNKQAGGDYGPTVAEFWPLALQLEDKDLEDARARLEAAKKKLAEAIERGASDNEIARLTEELRAALQQYLQSLVASGAADDGERASAEDSIDAADLDAMLDSIRDLAKSGAQNAARQALADLEALLENLSVSGGARSGEATGEGQGGATGKAGDLIGRQRDLADRSFERGETKDATGDDLAGEQGGLAGELSDLMATLGEGAADNPDKDGSAGKSFSRALSEMRRAEGALESEQFEAANTAMEQAIASLRDGAQSLARQQGAQARAARGQGGAPQPMRDPLGRPIGPAAGEGVDIPEKSDAQRARELLDELRRRLANGERTEEEIKYLERLLERF